MRWVGRRESSNIEDRRGMPGMDGGGLGGSFGGGGFGRGGGGLGIGAVALIVVVGWIAGVNPIDLLSSLENGTSLSDQGSGNGAGQTTGKVGAPTDKDGEFVATVLGDTETTWGDMFKTMGKTYSAPTLVIFDGSTPSACGTATTAAGPFYCPNDGKVYIDLAFYRELQDRFDAPGDFAEAYVVAHEVGHHVQDELGTLGKVDAERQRMSDADSNKLSIRIELQADCYAGIWARDEEKRGFIEVGDVDEALNAAAQVGDDAIQKRERGYAVPETFNHGTSAQRSRWFKRGYNDGTLDACDTFTPCEV
ncbi:MAG TPA: neutral zinc metallopeptidase [Bauldia sp.]